MGLKIEAATVEELEEQFGTSSSGNDPETVKYILGLEIGQGFKVQADASETDRMVKRRINACAKEAFRELDWRAMADGKTLAVRVKAIDTDAVAKAAEEAKAKEEPKVEEPKAEQKPAEKPANGSKPANAPQNAVASAETVGAKK